VLPLHLTHSSANESNLPEIINEESLSTIERPLTPKEINIIREYMYALDKLDNVLYHIRDVVYPEQNSELLLVGQIKTTKKFHKKIKKCLAFFSCEVDLVIVKKAKYANDKIVQDMHKDFNIAISNLSSAYNDIYLMTNIVHILEPVRYPMSFKIPYSKKDWFNCVTGKKIDFCLSDVYNPTLVGDYFDL